MKKLIVVLASALLCTGCSANSVDMFGAGTSSGKVNSLYGNKQSSQALIVSQLSTLFGSTANFHFAKMLAFFNLRC